MSDQFGGSIALRDAVMAADAAMRTMLEWLGKSPIREIRMAEDMCGTPAPTAQLETALFNLRLACADQYPPIPDNVARHPAKREQDWQEVLRHARRAQWAMENPHVVDTLMAATPAHPTPPGEADF